MINLRHPLAVLATRVQWAQIEPNLVPIFARRDPAGHVIESADLFGLTVPVDGTGVSPAGRPRPSMGLTVVALLYLKCA